MDPNLNQDISIRRNAAKSMGGRVFLWASIALMIGIGSVFFGIMDVNHLHERLRGEYSLERLLLPNLLDEREFMYIASSSLLASMTFVSLAWLLGRWAGSAIQVKRRSHGWVGPLVMLLPSILGSLVGTLMMAMQHAPTMRNMQGNPGEFFLIWGVGSLLVFLAAAIVGALAALYVRQVGRLFEDRRSTGIMDAPLFSMDALPLQLPVEKARNLGMKVFAGGAGLLAIVRMATYILLNSDHYSRVHGRKMLLAMVLAHLVFVLIAAITGRAAGAAILKRGAHFGIVGAGSLVLPTLAAPIVLRLLLYLFRPDSFIYAPDSPLDYYVYPVLENALLLFIPSVLLGIFAGLFLRHLGQTESEELAH